MIDTLAPIFHELANLIRCNRAATAAEYADVIRACVAQHVHHVAEVLRVAALVGADGDAIGVFLNGGTDDVRHAAVVTEVNHLGAFRLDEPTHDVDRGIVAVEQRGSGDESQGRLAIGRFSTRYFPGCNAHGRPPWGVRLWARYGRGQSRGPVQWPVCVTLILIRIKIFVELSLKQRLIGHSAT